MNLSPNRIKQLFVVGVAVLVGIGLFAISLPSQRQKDAKAVTTTTDKTTNQQVSTIKGENQSYGTNSKQPVYVGTSVLVSDTGFSTEQVKVLKQSIFEYIIANQTGTKQVSLDPKSIVTSINDPSNGGRDYATFNLVFDDKTTLKAKMYFDGISSTEVIFTDASGNQVYDSGEQNGSFIQ